MQPFVSVFKSLGWFGKIAFVMGGLLFLFGVYHLFIASGFGASFLLAFIYLGMFVSMIWFVGVVIYAITKKIGRL